MTERLIKKPKKKDHPQNKGEETPMEVETNSDEHEEEETDSNDEDDELSDQDALITDDVDGLERLNFEFEAVPLEQGDTDGIVNLLTQIFLRADIDCEGIAKILVSQSPFGCVYTPVEECTDEDNENGVYGVLSMFNLRSNEKVQQDIANFVLQKARKFAEKPVMKRIEDLFDQRTETNHEGLWMLVNEKMLHFPEQIAGPAFNSLKDDLAKSHKSIQFEHVIVIIKVRISDVDASTSETNSTTPAAQGKKKKGKAEKKRLAAAKLAEAKVVYDNPEEALLFQTELFPSLAYFQYPVQSEVEKQSKFHIIVRDGITYRPFRRVVILSKEQFFDYIDKVVAAF